MSADKRKKKQRAFAFLRDRGRGGFYSIDHFQFTGPPDANLRWLVRKGFGRLVRQAKGASPCGGRNYFVATDEFIATLND